MAIAVTVTYIDTAGGSQFAKIYGTLAFSGSYTAGGDGPPTWAGAGTQGAQIPSSLAPTLVWLYGIKGYTYSWVPSNGKILVQQGGAAVSSPEVEIAAGAYPAGVTGDTVSFEATFLKLQ